MSITSVADPHLRAHTESRPTVEVTALLNEQHYGDATYMTKRQLFATWPACAEDRQTAKHLWKPPGEDGESLAVGVLGRARAFVASLEERAPSVVAVTHHTAILALRSVLEYRPVTELVVESLFLKAGFEVCSAG
ncbi:histidine phosphatase family protein [Streptomyces sp. NPDC051561]|uniref:histidine phosphatase family protein n=1 Tax=Streptomyces sp. NPDC051561 TaxID=3365658 RepID=UPI0037A86C85